jgi:hypothetical protein
MLPTMRVIKVSLKGKTRRPVIVIGPLAFKFASGSSGRRCNKYEADLFHSAAIRRQRMLCPALWVMPGGWLLIMAAAKPLSAELDHGTYERMALDWDYRPGEDGCPFEPKASDWGWYEGRMVAVDYSTPALD